MQKERWIDVFTMNLRPTGINEKRSKKVNIGLSIAFARSRVQIVHLLR